MLFVRPAQHLQSCAQNCNEPERKDAGAAFEHVRVGSGGSYLNVGSHSVQK